MELVDLANTNPQLRAVLLAGESDSNVQVVSAPRPPTPPLVTIDGSAKSVTFAKTDDNKRKTALAPAAGSPPKKGDKANKPGKPGKPADSGFTGLPDSWKDVYMGLTPDKRVPGCCNNVPKIEGGNVTVLWATTEATNSIKDGRSHRLRSHAECSLLGLCHVDAPYPRLRALSLCNHPLDRNHVGPNAPMHQKPATFNSAMARGDFR